MAWDRVVCFGNDAVHSFTHDRLEKGLPPPDLEDAGFWNCAFAYVIKESTYVRNRTILEMVASFRSHFDTFFSGHDT